MITIQEAFVACGLFGIVGYLVAWAIADRYYEKVIKKMFDDDKKN
jgi:phage shock protein PspC (stress-responsive transcriptional regulator)